MILELHTGFFFYLFPSEVTKKYSWRFILEYILPQEEGYNKDVLAKEEDILLQESVLAS